MKTGKRTILLLAIILPFIMMEKVNAQGEAEGCIDNSYYTFSTRSKKINNRYSYVQKCPSNIGTLCIQEADGNWTVLDENDYQVTGVTCKITEGSIPSESYTFATCPADSEYTTIGTKLAPYFTRVFVPPDKRVHNDQYWKLSFKVEEFKQKYEKISLDNISVKLLVASNAKDSSLKDYGFIIDENNLPKTTNLTKGKFLDVFGPDGELFMPLGTQYILNYVYDDGTPNNVCNNTFLSYSVGVFGQNPSSGSDYYDSDICKSYRENNSDPKFSSLKQKFLPECYSTNYLSEKTEKELKDKVDEVQELLGKLGYSQGTDGSAQYLCAFKTKDDREYFAADNTKEKISTYTYFLEEDNNYWMALCTETLSLEYDDPKAVNEGSGFGYTTKITMDRVCQPYKITDPRNFLPCEYTVECYGGNTHHMAGPGAGPNDEFDSCIQQCDAGKYSQSCINSCYQVVYRKDTSMNSIIKSDHYISFLTSQRQLPTMRLNALNTSSGGLATVYSPDEVEGKDGSVLSLPISPRSSLCVFSGGSQESGACQNWECENEMCTTEHGARFQYTNGCGNAKCYEVFLNYPCLEATDGSKSSAEQFEEEFKQIQELIDNEELYKSENSEYRYKITIKENADEQKDGTFEKLETIFHNYGDYRENEYKINITESEITKEELDISIDEVYLEGNKIGDFKKIKMTKTITLDIGDAYIANADDRNLGIQYGSVYYNNHEEDKMKGNALFSFGGKKYYTHMNTQIINPLGSWPYIASYQDPNLTYDFYTHPLHRYRKEYENKKRSKNPQYDAKTDIIGAEGMDLITDTTNKYEKNIKVVLNNLGSWKQWGNENEKESIDISCFYGVTRPGGDKSKTGINYIYRTIDLDDVFPNDRSGRWNWTADAFLSSANSKLGYEVNPVKLLEYIEKKGLDIYTDENEVDYSFRLTSENIRAIRSYNSKVLDFNQDKYHNYLDYDMYCQVSDNKQYCLSRFLNNEVSEGIDVNNRNFITYPEGYSITSRQALAGCNNAYNGKCNDPLAK